MSLTLPIRVRCRETPDFEWVELTKFKDVTSFGASFNLKRPTEKGRLLHLTIPMPRRLRVFDHAEDHYKVWTLVRHVRAAASPADNPELFDVGVAFVGKRAPKSYKTNPATRYQITGSVGDSITFIEEPDEPIAFGTTDQRGHTRHGIPVDMLLEILNEAGEVALHEETVTENISVKGATLFTTLNIPVGRFIRLTSQGYKITIHAAVRARSIGADGIPRIHVEFVDKEWPE